jgi:hypothetical protein
MGEGWGEGEEKTLSSMPLSLVVYQACFDRLIAPFDMLRERLIRQNKLGDVLGGSEKAPLPEGEGTKDISRKPPSLLLQG